MNPSSLPLARLQGACKRYGTVRALDGVDLELHPGQLLALLGPNGAGKSTAVDLLLGMDHPDAGSARLFGLPPRSLAARQSVGVMLQSAGIPETLEVAELLDLTRSYYAQPVSVADCVALAGLNGLLGRRYGKLSGGQQRRVQFALAVCGRPRVLFLDEPTTGLDIKARQGVWRAIRELVADGCAVLLTTHYLEEAEALADRVAVLHSGRIVAEGIVAQVRARVSQRRIRCTTTLQAAEVSGWPQVRGARRDGESLELMVDRAEPVVLRLRARDPSLSDLEVKRAGLAEAFIEITRQPELEDAA